MAKSKNIYGWPIKREDFKTAVSDPETHIGIDKYAIDFPLKEDSDVLAVQDGKVAYIKDDSNEGGDDPKFIDSANGITIMHKNKEFSEYFHIKFKGAIVKAGDQVKKGQLIAKSGNTGYSSEPHLHFAITKSKSDDKWEAIEPIFEEKINILI